MAFEDSRRISNPKPISYVPSIRDKAYDEINQRIIEQLEAGTAPWFPSWAGGNADGRIIRPVNHEFKPYNGSNVVVLWSAAMARGYDNPVWMTFLNAKNLGGMVKKGETGSYIIKYQPRPEDPEDEETKKGGGWVKAYNTKRLMN